MEQFNQEESPFSQEEPSSEQAPEAAQQPETPAEPAGEPAQDSPEPAGEPAQDSLEPAGDPVQDSPEPAGEPAQDSPSPAGEFVDKVIKCAQCEAEFVHTADAQAFYKEKGFANEPKRCPACRKTRKTQSGYSPRGGSGGPRQMYPAVCADCNKDTQVPFEPSGARPVYCLDCYRKRQSGD